MKLQAQYNRISIISTLLILIVAAISYFFLLRYVLIRQLDEALKVEEAEINDFIRVNKRLPVPTVYKDQRVFFYGVREPGKRVFLSTEIYDSTEKEYEKVREIVFPVTSKDQFYMMCVSKSEESTQELVWIILFSTIALIVLLTLILFFTNRFLTKKLWRPFHQTLASLKDFNLSAPYKISLQPTYITEFKELNESIATMTQKVASDYQALKDFTNHASHEFQTPLAVINSKLDTLIQEPDLSEKSMEQINSMYDSLEKISRLSQSLLLLARIDNNQYADVQEISFHEILREKVEEMQEWVSGSDIQFAMELGDLYVKMNKELAEIMINNLLQNATRHNYPGGKVYIRTESGKLIISNTGQEKLDQDRIYDQFYKSRRSIGSGLGLAIVKKICTQYNFSVTYQFKDGIHSFEISFVQY